ncbi:hypothetical protein BaRGS_00008240 [Batillaria attramentaria]|uniref:Receptor ligand binding region domain-containing protein n=1 Tax=Batillaria attramentaria TaxID=370345 RepID=A0ABD0LML5_9CAEN
MAAYDLANKYGWNKISVFYDDDRGVTLMEKLMTNHTMTVRGWRLPPLAGEQEVKTDLVEMRKVLVEQSVVICSKHNTQRILDQARGLAMLSTPPYKWLFYDPGHELQDLLLNSQIQSREMTKLDYAYVHDALSIVTSAYTRVSGGGAHGGNVSHTPLTFRQEMSKVIEQTESEGQTGHVAFTPQGERDNFTLILSTITGNGDEVIEVSDFANSARKDKVIETGVWFSRVDLFDSRLQLNADRRRTNRSTPFPLKGRTAKVVMIEVSDSVPQQVSGQFLPG